MRKTISRGSAPPIRWAAPTPTRTAVNRMQIRHKIPFVAGLALAVAGCNDDAPTVPISDGGGAGGQDAASGTDAGTSDADGSTSDAGQADGGGAVTDTGGMTDIGGMIDVGGTDAAPADAGPADAGPSSEIGERLRAFCRHSIECGGADYGDPERYYELCVGQLAQVERAFSLAPPECQQAAIDYIDCYVGTDCAIIYGGGEYCTEEYDAQEAACPEDFDY